MSENDLHSTLVLSASQRQQLASIDPEILGGRIRRARLDKRFSQRDLVEGLFTSAYLSSVELGRTRPTASTVVQLSSRLEKPIAYFIHPIGDEEFPELNEEQDLLMQTHFKLFSIQVKLASGANSLAIAELEEMQPDLDRLSSAERAFYYYLNGTAFNQAGEYNQALIGLAPAGRILASTGVDDPENVSVSGLELLIMLEYAQGKAEAGQNRLLVALGHYRRALELVQSVPTQEDAPESDTFGNRPEFLNPKLVWELHLALAEIYLTLGDTQQALHHFQVGLDQIESRGAGNLSALADSFLALAEIYEEQTDYTKASFYLGKSSQIYQGQADRRALYQIHSNLAQLQLRTENYTAAEQTAQVAQRLELELAATGASDNLNAAPLPAQLSLASAYLKQNKLKEAGQLLNNLLQSQNTTKPTQALLELYRVAAELAVAKGVRTEAESYYQQALGLLEASPTAEQSSSVPASTKAELYYSYGQQLRKWGDPDRAFEYLDKALRLRRVNR